MILKEIKNENFIPNNTPYNNENWFLYVNDFLKSALLSKYGKREIIIDEDVYYNYFNPNNTTEFKNAVVDEVKNAIDVLFKVNNFKYKKLYYALNLTYNPLWNVDGTETLTYTKENTGTVENVGSVSESEDIEKKNTGTETTENSNTNVVDEDNTKTISDSETINNETSSLSDKANTGTQTNVTTYSGSETNTNTKSGEEVNEVVPFTTQIFTNHDKTIFDDVVEQNVKSFNNRQDNAARTDLLDEQIEITATDDTTISKSISEQFENDVTTTDTGTSTRTDNLTETVSNDKSTDSTDTRTDDLTESYSETRTRTGNIGVTKTQDLLESEYKFRNEMDFAGLVLSDVINEICYGVY